MHFNTADPETSQRGDKVQLWEPTDFAVAWRRIKEGYKAGIVSVTHHFHRRAFLHINTSCLSNPPCPRVAFPALWWKGDSCVGLPTTFSQRQRGRESIHPLQGSSRAVPGTAKYSSRAAAIPYVQRWGGMGQGGCRRCAACDAPIALAWLAAFLVLLFKDHFSEERRNAMKLHIQPSLEVWNCRMQKRNIIFLFTEVLRYFSQISYFLYVSTSFSERFL